MIIYTDGSARPTNPGPGGFGVVVLDDKENLITTYSKHFDTMVTNNQMELKAILYTLIVYGHLNPIVYSDSAYAINCFTTWRHSWERNGWLKGDGREPENLDLIKTYTEIWNSGKRIQLQKVKGHSSNKWNELADRLAVKGE